MADTVNTSGDWWQANSPSMRSVSGSTAPTGGGSLSTLGNVYNTPTGFNDAQITQMMQGQPVTQPQRGGGDAQALIQQYQQSHPPNDIAGLENFLRQNGVQVTRATHANGTLQSDDKLIINGVMTDLISDVGGPGAKWQYSPEGGGDQGGFGSLAQGWDQNFTAPSAEEFMNSPGIQAGLKLGQQALERSAASKGTLLTGGMMKDLNAFAGDYASQKYGEMYGRSMGEYGMARDTFYKNQGNLFDRNFSLAQLGQNSASNMGMQGQQSANQQSDLLVGQGDSRSQATVTGANAWMPTYGSIANMGQDYLTARTRSSY